MGARYNFDSDADAKADAAAKKAADNKKPAKDKEPETITKDGLFISRRLRREAKEAAEAEVATNERVAEADADAADLAAYEAKFPNQTNAEKTHNAEQAQVIATDEAREKAGLDTTKSRKEAADAAAKDAEKARLAEEKAAADAAKKADK